MSLKPQAKKRLLLLLCGFLLIVGLGVGAFALHIYRVRSLYTDYRQRGLTAEKDGNNVVAVNLLEHYLLRYPDDLDVLAAFARVRPKVEMPQGEHIKQTIAALRELIQRDPTRVEAWRESLELYYRVGMSSEAVDAANGLLAIAPKDAEAQQVKIGALMRLRRYADALSAAQARVAVAPDDWMAQINRIWAMNQLGHPSDELMGIADQLLQAHPDDQGALLLQACTDEMASDFPNAAVQLRAAAARPCKDKSVGVTLIQQLDGMGMHAESLNVLRGLAQTNNPDAERALLRRYWEDSRVQEAADLCAGSYAAELKDPESQGIYADCLRRLGKTSESAAVRAGLAAIQNDPVAAAWAAVEDLESTVSLDQVRGIRDACSAAVARFPQDYYLIYFEGVADASLGEIDAAIDLWKGADKLSRNWALPLVSEAQQDLAMNHQEAAAHAAAEACQRDPTSTTVAVTQAMVWFAAVESGDTTVAGKLNDLIDEIQKRDPGEEQTQRMRVSLLARSGQNDKAIQTLRDLINRHPPISAKGLLSLANVSRQWRLEMEDQCLAALAKDYGQTPESALSLALDDWTHHHADQGVRLLQDAAESAKDAQAVGYRLALATYLEAIGDPGDLAAWTAVADAYPHDLTVQRATLASPTAYRDRDLYDRTINRMRDLLGDSSITWKLARARWLMEGSSDQQTTTQAMALLKDVLQRQPESVGANVMMSMAKERSGDVNGAADQLASAQRLDPKSPAMALDLARLLQYRGDFDAARQQLDQVATAQSSPDQRAATAMMLAEQGDLAKAIEILEPLANDPQAPASRKLDLATLYSRAGQFDRAQAICDVLLKHPDAPTILLAAQIQMFRRNPHGADTILAGLDDLKWPPGGEDLALGDFEYRFGQLREALSHYRAATNAAPHNAVYWLSMMDCQAMMDTPVDLLATASDAVKLLPDNAQLIAIQKESDLIQNAGASPTRRQLLSALLRDPSPSGPAVTTLRTIEDLETSDVTIDQAAQTLAKLSTDLPRFSPAQTAVVEGDLRIGRVDDALQTAARAAAAFPTDPISAELAVAALSESQRWDEALQMAKTWKSRVVGDPFDVDMKIAQIQLQLRDAAGAITTMQPYQNAPELTQGQQWQIDLTQAEAMVQLGNPDDAAALLWKTVASVPAARPAWLQFVASVLPTPQAEKWLNRTADLLSKQPHADSMLVMLAEAWNQLWRRTADKHYAQIARDLARRLEQSPEAGAMAAAATGIFADQDGDPNAAQAAYRRALAKAEIPQVQNNLAMALATGNGDLNEAARLAERATQLDPNQANYFDTLAFVQGRAKNYDPAIAAQQTAVRLEPDNPKWRVNLAKLLINAGKTDQAKRQIADLDGMTPGVRALTPDYQKQLDILRRQLNSTGAAPLTPVNGN
jgi:cellulose synthase operon protein C